MFEPPADVLQPKEIVSRVKAQVGWSLLQDSPNPNQIISPNSLMREKEIISIRKYLSLGKKVFVYGNDGFGKTTFLTEFGSLLKEEGKPYHYIPSPSFKSAKGLQHTIEYLEYISGNKDVEKPIIMVDSADYLWEETKDPSLIEMRRKFYEYLLNSNLNVVFTFHQKEPIGKKVDLKTKWEIFKKVETINRDNIEVFNLEPGYSQEKVQEFLIQLGFNEKVAHFISGLEIARNHALLKNYFVKEWKSKQYHKYLNDWSRDEANSTGFFEYVKNIFKRYDRERMGYFKMGVN